MAKMCAASPGGRPPGRPFSFQLENHEMKKFAALLLCLLPYVAFGYWVDECKPMGYFVTVQMDSDIAEDIEQRLSRAVETRLRSARLYENTAIPAIVVTAIIAETSSGGEANGFAAAIHMEYKRWGFISDEWFMIMSDTDINDYRESLLFFPTSVSVWDRSILTLEPLSDQGNYAIQGALELLDDFILEYLRRNEAFCT